MCDVDDAGGLLDTLFEREVASSEVEFLQLRFSRLSALASGCSVVSLKKY
jgi:hypothetical protein